MFLYRFYAATGVVSATATGRIDFDKFSSSHWPWTIKVNYDKSGSIATKRKSNLSIERQAWNASNGIDFGDEFDLEFSRWNVLYLMKKLFDCHKWKLNASI